MYELSIAILGSGDTVYNNAADLLWDLLPDDYMVYVPSYINSDGMKTVMKFLQDEKVNYERVKKSNLIETLVNSETKSQALVVLNPDGIENEISRCLEMKIPVLDLTRGLYQITEVPLASADSHASELTDAQATPVSPRDDLDSGPVLARLKILEEQASKLLKEVRELHAHVSVGETNWEPVNLPVQGSEEIAITGSEDIAEGTVAYWKSKRGKYRKAGNSKARPGEEKVYLTEEEIARLD